MPSSGISVTTTPELQAIFTLFGRVTEQCYLKSQIVAALHDLKDTIFEGTVADEDLLMIS